MSPGRNPQVVIVGGGIGGSALAISLVRSGIETTILEKSTAHVDRVRGEWISPWGVAEAERLGIYELLRQAGGHHVTRHVAYGDEVDPATAMCESQDLTMFANAGFKPPLCIGHPHSCDVLNAVAVQSGVQLLRGVNDVRVTPGASPEVRFHHNGGEHIFTPRLVIGADGRNSIVRGQAGIELHRDPTHHLMAGMLVDEIEGWPDSVQTLGTEDEVNFLVFPQSPKRARLYVCYGIDQKRRFAGTDNQARFLDAFRLRCVPDSHYIANGVPAGPCNSYSNEDSWTDTPLAPGVVLIGDAAGHNDPIIGQGLSITYRDARMVRDLMFENRDWAPAIFAPYVVERKERMRRLRFVATMFSILYVEFGEHARKRRIKYREERMKNPAADPTLAAMLGPEIVPAEAFSEEVIERLKAA
jgi:menaquinone-9 beta-reductase